MAVSGEWGAPNFDEVQTRRDTESYKWKEYPEDVLPLFVAEMDFRSPEPVARAIRQFVDRGVFGYPRGLHTFDVRELPELPEVVATRMFTRYGWRVQPEDVVIVPGVIPALNLSCRTVEGEGGAVLVQPPVYPPILAAPRNARLLRYESQLLRRADGTFETDWDLFQRGITPDVRMFTLCNPHNPVGRVFRKDELLRMAEICLSRNVLICADEIHSDLLFTGHTHVPIASLAPEIAQQTITLVSPSKTFNLAGLQCAFAIIPNADLRKRFQAARAGMVPWVNVMGLIGADAAYREGQPWLDRLLPYLEANRDYLRDFVQQQLPGVQMTVPEGTFLAWLDCRQLELADPFTFFLEKARVALSSGAAFGTGGSGFVRLNFGCPRAILSEALGRMRRALFG